jgi:hypothetical protein
VVPAFFLRGFVSLCEARFERLNSISSVPIPVYRRKRPAEEGA